MTRSRLDAMQWFGFLAAPVAWAVQLVVASYLAEAHCEAARLGTGWSPAEIAVIAPVEPNRVAQRRHPRSPRTAISGVETEPWACSWSVTV